MKVFVKTLAGTTVAVEVQPADSLETIKDRIREKWNVPPSHQRLQLSGRFLHDDGKSVADNGVQEGDTLQLMLRAAPALSLAGIRQNNGEEHKQLGQQQSLSDGKISSHSDESSREDLEDDLFGTTTTMAHWSTTQGSNR